MITICFTRIVPIKKWDATQSKTVDSGTREVLVLIPINSVLTISDKEITYIMPGEEGSVSYKLETFKAIPEIHWTDSTELLIVQLLTNKLREYFQPKNDLVLSEQGHDITEPK